MISLYIICGVFALIGAWVLKAAVEEIKTANATKLWPSVKGKLISASLHRQRSPGTHTREQYHYKVNVKYEYVVGRIKYTSYQLNLSTASTSNKAKVEEKITRLKEKEHVEVFYNHQNPKVALLEPGVSSGSFMVFFGLVFLLFGILIPLLVFFTGKGSADEFKNRGERADKSSTPYKR